MEQTVAAGQPAAGEETAATAAHDHTAPSRAGACIWLTGPSGAGKSTLTAALVPRLEVLGRTVSVLDVVPLLAKAPGERSSEGKLLRKAFVAGEIARHGGIAICVTVSARREVRERAREVVGADRFVEVHVDVPAEVAAARRAARGRRVPLRRRARELRQRVARFVGAKRGLAYEPPDAPDVRIDTSRTAPDVGAEAVLAALRARGLLPSGNLPRTPWA
ncbi:adenylyl-sulfate kinase [Egicoccus sp. AB-alg2]|uniref:adenylyl-sulfate kinase n=1 Tax=Egicoccus sp. AB-alg2 TaxID=3242693 RepID=UPI00359D39B9